MGRDPGEGLKSHRGQESRVKTQNSKTVHPPSNGVYRRRRNGRLKPGTPATPGTTRLGLLPFGPDPVHACSAAAGPGRQRRPIPVLTRYTLTLGREFGPASRGFRVQGTPSAPPSTVTRMVATVPNTEPEAPQKVAIWSLPARSPAEPGPERPAAERQGAGKMALRK